MIHKLFLIGALCLIACTLKTSYAQSATPTDSDAKILSPQKFTMTPEQMAAGIRGEVKVVFTIAKTGEVKRAAVYAGPAWPCGTSPVKEIEEVRKALENTIKSAKFSPKIKDGKPVESDAMLSFDIDKAFNKPVPPGRTVIGGVVNGKAKSLPKPEYPRAAREQRASGSVTVMVLINESGSVISAGAVSGNPLLQLASRDSACGAKFSPTVVAGQPVKVSGIITYNFVP